MIFHQVQELTFVTSKEVSHNVVDHCMTVWIPILRLISCTIIERLCLEEFVQAANLFLSDIEKEQSLDCTLGDAGLVNALSKRIRKRRDRESQAASQVSSGRRGKLVQKGSLRKVEVYVGVWERANA